MKFSFESALYLGFVFILHWAFLCCLISGLFLCLISLSLSLSREPLTLIIYPILALGDCVYVCVFWHGPQITTVCEIDTAESEGGDEDYQT
jgi:hypothetical protein